MCYKGNYVIWLKFEKQNLEAAKLVVKNVGFTSGLSVETVNHY